MRTRRRRTYGECRDCGRVIDPGFQYCDVHDLSGKCPSCKRPYDGRSTCDCGSDPWRTSFQETR